MRTFSTRGAAPAGGGGISAITALMCATASLTTERRSVEDEAELGLSDRELLPGSDVERDAVPALVVDPELERRVGLGRRACSDSRRRAVAVVLAAHVAGGIGSDDTLEQAMPRRIERFALTRGFHRRRGEELQEMVTTTSRRAADGVVEATSVLDAETFGQRQLDTRKICSSRTDRWSSAASSLAEARSCPNGFSTTTRASLASPDSARPLTTRPKRDGGVSR